MVDKPSSKPSVVLEIKSSGSHTGRRKIGVPICFSVNTCNCMWIVVTLHLLNVSCKIIQQILVPIFPDFISPPGGIISFNISGFSKKGQEAFK